MRKRHSFELDNQPKSHFGFVQGSVLIIRWKNTLYKPFTKVLMHTQRATRAREHLVSISSIVPAVCTWFVRDLRLVAKIKGCLCLPAYLKILIKLSTWRTSACVPTLTKNAVIGHLRVPKILTFKMRPCAQPFSRECPGELGNGLLRTTNLELLLLKCLQNVLWHYAIYVAKKYCIAMDKFRIVEALTLRLSGGARFHFVLCFLPWFYFSQTETMPESCSKFQL